MSRVAPKIALWLGAVVVAAGPLALRGDDPALTTENRMEIIRTLSYEYATLQIPLPYAKKDREAVEMNGQGVIDEDRLRKQLSRRGVVLDSGSVVQITDFRIKDKEILIEINGGGEKGTKWYERITIAAGSGSTPPAVYRPGQGKQPGQFPPGSGSWLKVKFKHEIPDMTSDGVKELLASVLDFDQASATVAWIDTIPEEFRDAIKEKRAVVGMDREMVLAALGRPVNKVRETRSDGQEYEDWIYGIPPFMTFVTFLGDEVIDVREFD